MKSRAQIIVTIGPASSNKPTFYSMAEHQADVARLNFSWGNEKEKMEQIQIVRSAEEKFGKKIPIVADLPGPRVQQNDRHTYVKDSEVLTHNDVEHIKFGIAQNVDYFAVSFVGTAKDVKNAREKVRELGGTQKIIAKVERATAVDHLDEIIKEADAVMVARGDLGNEIPVEQIPFVQRDIIKRTKRAEKPVIVATEMMLSMTARRMPTRAEVSDVSDAIIEGADAVMLSEETARGAHPRETVEMMERIIVEAERHLPKERKVRAL